MKTILPFLAVFLMLLTYIPVRAEQAHAGADLIARLEQARANCNWKTRTLTGGPKGKMLLHQRSMDNVLEKLKAGEPVDPRAIDHALQGHPV